MGAVVFVHRVPVSLCSSPGLAFHHAIEEAGAEVGFDGYSGTIVEKHDYVLFDVDSSMSIDDFVHALTRSRPGKVVDEVYEMAGEAFGHGDRIVEIFDDKWGPAVCFELDGCWVFTGWASC